MASFNQFRHLTVKEGKKQSPDVRTVNVGVRHQDDLVVSELS